MTDERRQIGARIAEARRQAGLTQRELAERLGVTPRSIQNYESGAVVPYKHLRRIETLAHKRVGWILAGDGSESPLAETIDRLEGAMERHLTVLQEHLETLRREVTRLREQREYREAGRRATRARAAPPGGERADG